MFRSLLGRAVVTLERKLINGDSSSSSSAAKYFVFTRFQNQNVVVTSNSRVTNSIFNSFSTTTGNDSSNSFVVSYLINSCGLSENQAITASEKLNFKTKSNPDSVRTLFKAYGLTEPHISKLIIKYPAILMSNPHKTLKPKLDFFKSKGIDEIDLANFISRFPNLLKQCLNTKLIPNFDLLRSVVQSDQNVITMIQRNSWMLSTCKVKRVMINLELLRNEGVPEASIVRYLIQQPRAYIENDNKFKEIVEKVKDMGFNQLETRFLKAVIGLTSMTEVNWREKMDVYKRWGWSEDQIHAAFRKHPGCMKVSEKKIMAVMNYLVNETGYDSPSVAEAPLVFSYSLKSRIIPRCSVIRILVSKGLIEEMISINYLSSKVDDYFVKNFVKKYEQQVPELMKVFQGQLNYQNLLQS